MATGRPRLEHEDMAKPKQGADYETIDWGNLPGPTADQAASEGRNAFAPASPENPWADAAVATENPWDNTAPAQPNAPGVQSFGDWLRAKDAAKEAAVGGTDNTPEWMQGYLASPEFQSMQSPQSAPQAPEPAAPRVAPSEQSNTWLTEQDGNALRTQDEMQSYQARQPKPNAFSKLVSDYRRGRAEAMGQPVPTTPQAQAPTPRSPTPVSYKKIPGQAAVMITMSDGQQHMMPLSDPNVVKTISAVPQEQQS